MLPAIIKDQKRLSIIVHAQETNKTADSIACFGFTKGTFQQLESYKCLRVEHS